MLNATIERPCKKISPSSSSSSSVAACGRCGGGRGSTCGTTLPHDVRRVLTYLEGMTTLEDWRVIRRWKFVKRAELVDQHDQPRELWLRDINRYNTGFISRYPVAMGASGPIRFALPDGRLCDAHGRVMRCREITPGWFEGYVNFSEALSDGVAELTRRGGRDH